MSARGVAGGKAGGAVLHRRAVERYRASPVICRHCKEIVPLRPGVKPSEIKRLKFCSRSCAAKHNNLAGFAQKRFKKPRKIILCRRCNAPVMVPRRVFCTSCNKTRSILVTLGNKPIGKCTPAQRSIHAKFIMRAVPRVCRCGYAKHVEVCHIRAVRSFPKETLLREVNDIDNLLHLCPNCHWEFDHPESTG